MAAAQLILASASTYRHGLLARLGLAFECLAADVDESRRAGETVDAMAMRLALAKAHWVADQRPGALVVGSDQAAECNGQLLGKPGDSAAAHRQLRGCSGRNARFVTAVCVLDARGPEPVVHRALDVTEVLFRHLHDDEILRYLEHDEPFDCAGSFKAEALGISLFERVRSDDPTALVGLPLIALCRLLRDSGLALP